MSTPNPGQQTINVDVSITYHPVETPGVLPQQGPGYHWKFKLLESDRQASPQVEAFDPYDGSMIIKHVGQPFRIHYWLNPKHRLEERMSESRPTARELKFVNANISTNLSNGSLVNDQIGGTLISPGLIGIEYTSLHRESRKFGVILVAMSPLQPYFAICSPDPQVVCHPPH